ncbi:DUF2398 family protein [Streptomyces sp. NPDC007883]|uniref:DUF2398 family protein n=1 Tax=Streptomyces sp. NPDC007883 TaxID=3155116 RepID=UPI0033EE4D69
MAQQRKRGGRGLTLETDQGRAGGAESVRRSGKHGRVLADPDHGGGDRGWPSRGFLTARITELTGLVAEVRGEGIAMVDPDDDLTDLRREQLFTCSPATSSRMPAIPLGPRGHAAAATFGRGCHAVTARFPDPAEGDRIMVEQTVDIAALLEHSATSGASWSKEARLPAVRPASRSLRPAEAATGR